MSSLGAALSAQLGGGEGIAPAAAPSGITANTARDLLSDPNTGELVIANGDLVLVYGIDSIAQDIRMALRFFQGEFFGDQTIGTPYFQRILGVKGPDLPNLPAIQSALQERILGRLGVTGINNFTMDLDRSKRTLSVVSEVQSDLGPINIDTSLALSQGGT